MTQEPVRSVEISGFGRFMVSSIRLARMLNLLHKKKVSIEDNLANGNLKDAAIFIRKPQLAGIKDEIQLLNRKQMKIDFKGIMEGVKNSILVTEQVELVAKERTSICKGCLSNSENQKKYNGYKSFRPDLHCTVCGCDIHLKTRSLSSSCPLGKWVAQLTEDQEQELKKKIDGQVETE